MTQERKPLSELAKRLVRTQQLINQRAMQDVLAEVLKDMGLDEDEARPWSLTPDLAFVRESQEKAE